MAGPKRQWDRSVMDGFVYGLIYITLDGILPLGLSLVKHILYNDLAIPY